MKTINKNLYKIQDSDRKNAQDKNWSGYQAAYDAHMSSADNARSEALISLLIGIAALGYAYYDGVFDELLGSASNEATLVLDQARKDIPTSGE